MPPPELDPEPLELPRSVRPRRPRQWWWSLETPTPTGVLVTATPQLRLREIFGRFWPLTRPFRGRLAVSLVLVVVSPVLDTAGIWLFKILVDDVLTPADFRLFPTIAAAYVGLTLLGGLVSFANTYLSSWVGARFVLGLRTKVFAHIQGLSLGFFERRALGDVLSRLTSDVGAIEQLVLSGVARALSYAIKIVLFTGALFFLNWRLALASLVAAPAFLLASRFFARRIKEASREKRRRSGSITAVAEESLGNIALVQAYDRAAAETERFHQENLGSFAAQMVATRLRALFTPLIDLLEVVGVLLVVGLGVWQLATGGITLGGLLVFMAYLMALYSPIRGVGRLSNSVYAASAGAERVIELLDQEPDVGEQIRPVRRVRPLSGELRVEKVSFAYPGTDQPALTDVSFAVAPGEKLAVVGASGAGKSTLAKLLLRFYDPDEGHVRLGGYDLRELELATLRANVTAVLQETLVFDGTVRENILWGRPGATDRQLRAAASAADAHEFITALPDGYDTRVGQRGRLLSGGQRQRLAIARAMIRKAPVLLLDEPTTGLDAGSAHRILAPLRRLMAGRTTIIISHNLLTVTDADTILFLEEGRISARGTHAELLAQESGYAQLVRQHRLSDDEPRLRQVTRAVSIAATVAPQRVRRGVSVAAAVGAMTHGSATSRVGTPVRDGPPPRAPGEEIAPGYVVIEHKRRGRDFDAYDAWSDDRHSRCFLKTLRPDRCTHAPSLRSLRQEARLLLGSTHPHLVRAYELVDPPDEAPVLVLETLTGATLSYLLSDVVPRLAAPDLGNLGQHLCSAVRYLHGRGYLHLDIKPGNIVASEGSAHLIDLSLARRPGPCRRGRGTVPYMAPEQASGGVLGPAADVWGIGLTLYEAATGFHPFAESGDHSDSSRRTRYLQLERAAPRIRARRRLPHEIADLVDGCLSREPDRRPSLADLDAGLAPLADAE